jgi:hypothetical protein
LACPPLQDGLQHLDAGGHLAVRNSLAGDPGQKADGPCLRQRSGPGVRPDGFDLLLKQVNQVLGRLQPSGRCLVRLPPAKPAPLTKDSSRRTRRLSMVVLPLSSMKIPSAG